MTHVHMFSEIGGRTIQQDHVFVSQNVRTCHDILVIVADGHSPGGELYARKSTELLSAEFASCARIRRKDIVRMFKRVDKLLEADDTISQASGGTTATVLYVSEERWIVANVGDSPAVAIARNGVARVLTKDHSADNLKEVEKAKERGLVIVGPYFRQSNSTLGLAVARTLGDFARKPGISHRPFVKVKKKPLNGRFLLVATDGLMAPCTAERIATNPLRFTSLAEGHSFDVTVELFTKQLAKKRYYDNVSGVLVDLDDFYGR